MIEDERAYYFVNMVWQRIEAKCVAIGFDELGEPFRGRWERIDHLDGAVLFLQVQSSS